MAEYSQIWTTLFLTRPEIEFLAGMVLERIEEYKYQARSMNDDEVRLLLRLYHKLRPGDRTTITLEEIKERYHG